MLSWRLDTVINQKLSEIEDLRAKAQSVSGIDYSKEKTGEGFAGNAGFVRVVERIITLKEDIDREINEFADQKHKIINQIQGLENLKHVEVLYKRYVEYKRLAAVAKEMNYSFDRTRHLHGYALFEFEKKYLKDKVDT